MLKQFYRLDAGFYANRQENAPLDYSRLEKRERNRYEGAVNLSPYFEAMSASLGSQGANRGLSQIAGRAFPPPR
jgi:hypothetical protein